MFNRVVPVQRIDLVKLETAAGLQFAEDQLCRMTLMKSGGFRQSPKVNRNSSKLFIGPFIRIVAALHIAFSWSPFPIGQVRF